MRYMGLDVGDRTIGVAVSDPLGYTAQGLTTVRRKSLENDFDKKSLQYSVQYEKSLEKLIDRFNKNKDVWVESIYNNCLDA